MKSITILYHANCPDGFSAAWAAWKKFMDTADYMPVEHQTPPPELKDKIVYLLDFSYKAEVMKKIAKENKELFIIDHHITAEKEIKLLVRSAKLPATYNLQLTTILEMDHSGSYLAWKHFHPTKSVPKIIQYVEDSDLWRFKKTHTKEVTMILSMEPFTFKAWDKFAKKLEKKKALNEIIKKGKNISDYENSLVQRIASKAVSVEFENHKVSAVNSPILISEIGNELIQRNPPLGIVWYADGNKIKVSLRGNGNIDLSKIAEKYGGGGHKNAAGFKLPQNSKVPWKT